MKRTIHRAQMLEGREADTLARLQFMTGETNEAVATEQKAVAAEPDEAKGPLQQTLADYQAGKLPDVKH